MTLSELPDPTMSRGSCTPTFAVHKLINSLFHCLSQEFCLMQISANHHEIRKGCFLYLTYGKSLFEYLDVLVFSFFFCHWKFNM